jgi:hypothetical protein
VPFGTAPTATGLNWLAAVFDKHFSEDLRLPLLYPAPEGGIQAEWRLFPNEISLEINLDHLSATWHALNMESMEEEYGELNLNADEDWAWLLERLRTHAGAA